MKKFLIFVLAVMLLGGCNSVSLNSNNNSRVACSMEAKLCPDGSAVGRTGPNCEFAPCPGSETADSFNLQNGTYIINNKSVTLKNGYNETVIVPGAAAQEITRYFGNPVVADFNNDGVLDAAFLLTQESGGSGVFYYLAAKLGNQDKGANAVLLGDRIAPQTTEFKNGRIIVNYADRKPGEPFTVSPSVGVSRYFQIVSGALKEVAAPTNGQTSARISGQVLLGPTCPVEKIPPDPACAPKPYQTAIQVIVLGSPSSQTFATAKSNAQGYYELSLPAGQYALQPSGGATLPRCETKEITVKAGLDQIVNLSCDTGIR